MADGKFLIGKPAGGVTTVTMTDGASNTNLVLPESGTVATLSNIQGFKNLIINGRKQVNQSGLTTTDNAYNYDNHYKVGSNWFQFIDGKNIISGDPYTLSWYGAATAGYYIGTAGATTINAQTFTAIANGETITPTITSSQILWIKFASDSTGSTYNNVQFEPGTAPTPYEQRLYELEESLIQSGYIQLGTGFMAGVDSGDSQKINISGTFPIRMRRAPTISLIGNISFRINNGTVNIASPSIAIVSSLTTGVGLSIITSSGVPINSIGYINKTAPWAYADARPY